jgi:hypothetical protein
VGASKRHIGWHVDVLSLDFSYHLPLFLGGLVETDPPYNFLAYEGAIDMIMVGGPRNRLLPAVQAMIPAIKIGLQSGHRPSVSKSCYVLLLLLNSDKEGTIGRAVAPYLPRLLPTLQLYTDDSHSIGVDGCYQMAENNMSTLVSLLLEAVENKCGRMDVVYKIIKYAIPTYSSTALGL